MDEPSELERAQSLIAAIPDCPEPGVVFRDLTPLFADAAAFRRVIDAMVEPFAGRFDAVAGIEARGFVLAGAASRAADVGPSAHPEGGQTCRARPYRWRTRWSTGRRR